MFLELGIFSIIQHRLLDPNVQATNHIAQAEKIDIFVKLSDAQRSMFGLKLAHDARIQSESDGIKVTVAL